MRNIGTPMMTMDDALTLLRPRGERGERRRGGGGDFHRHGDAHDGVDKPRIID